MTTMKIRIVMHYEFKLKNNTLSITNSINKFLGAKNPDFFKNGIYFLVDRWQMCVDAAGNYFD